MPENYWEKQEKIREPTGSFRTKKKKPTITEFKNSPDGLNCSSGLSNTHTHTPTKLKTE